MLKTTDIKLTENGILLIAAMPEELQEHFRSAGIPVFYTGLGKVNATYHLASLIAKFERSGQSIRAVVNFGTAGSSHFKTHELIEITRFVQRDMDLSPLGFARGTTPYDQGPAVVEVPKVCGNLPSGTCGTGDNFEVAHPETEFSALDDYKQESFFDEPSKSLLVPHYDVVDMEAYALAKVCRLAGLRFVCIKYISDGADHLAQNDWVANLPRAAARFFKFYPELLRSLAD